MDHFSRMPYLCGFQSGQVRDERFLEILFENSKIGNFVRAMSMSGSTDAYKLSESCFQGVRLMLTKCPTESLGGIPIGGTVCSLRGNTSFPTWEQAVPKLGIYTIEKGSLHSEPFP